ncbi:MAG: PAS domain S-box protein [Nitrospirota bacterium]|nr:MAG: PAS domain S-box protein [Nitrospirota bacterium]
MKRLFYSFIAVFVFLSIAGMTVTGIYLFRASKEMTRLIDSNVSLLKRSELSIESENLRETMFFSGKRDEFGKISLQIKGMLESCGDCHHGESGGQRISEMISVIEGIIDNDGDEAHLGMSVDRIHKLSHDALFSGQILVSDRVADAVRDAKRSWIIFIFTILFGLFVIIAISMFFLNRFDKNIGNIMEATEAVRRGKKIDRGLFGKDLESLADAMESMQSEIMINEEKIINWAKQWQTAFNSVDSMMALCDIDGTVIIVNRAFHKIFGTDDQIEGRSLQKVVCFQHENEEDCAIAKTLKAASVQTEVIKIDGYTLFVKTFPVLSDTGDITGVLWIGRDITKEKELEERAIQSEKLVALGELVAGIAHEVNNPLSAVVGFSEILKDSTKLEDDDRGRVEKIYSAAIRVSKIIRNLLEFSRKRPSDFARNDLNNIIEKVIELKEYELHVEDIEIKKEFKEIPEIECDTTQIQQVMLNLINNAHNAISDKGGKGTISLRTYPADGRVYVEITDTGIGMSRDVMSRIYEPFFTTKDVGKGTGLGLSIVYSAVKAHGGDIRIESEEGKGSTFIVSFPVNMHEEV